MNSEILSVSLYLDRLNLTLKSEKAKINGEISNLQMYEGRSYLYYSLKDSKDGSSVKCFMWKNDYKLSGLKLEDGLEVFVSATPEIYKPNGGLTLKVESIELVGEGALKIAYDKLKNKLESEGLFSDQRKRNVPIFPHKIGVITSKSGAVINDFLSNIGKYGFEISFVDSKVEGGDAIKDLLNSINTLESEDIDVLVIMRGGGSLESFTAFNNETLVRTVANFKVPVITGIGHDKDIPLISLVSDKNVSTPTAVTHILNESWNMASSSINFSEEKILSSFSEIIKDKIFEVESSKILIEKKFVSIFELFKKSETIISELIQKIDNQIIRLKDSIINISKDILVNYNNNLTILNSKIDQFENNIKIYNPEKQLKMGYSIVKLNNKIIRSTREVNKDDKLDISLSDGIIQTKAL